MTLLNKHPPKIRGGSHLSHCAERKALRNKHNSVPYMPCPMSPQQHPQRHSLLTTASPHCGELGLLLRHPQLPATSPHAPQGWAPRHRRESTHTRPPDSLPSQAGGHTGSAAITSIHLGQHRQQVQRTAANSISNWTLARKSCLEHHAKHFLHSFSFTIQVR